MNISPSSRRAAFVLAFVAAGASLGYGLLYIALPAIARHLPAETAPNANGTGSVVAAIVGVGSNIGPVLGIVLAAGLLVVTVVFGSLWAGLALARHIR